MASSRARAAIAAMPQPVEVSEEELAVTVAEALALLSPKTTWEDRADAVAKALRAAGFRITKGWA